MTHQQLTERLDADLRQHSAFGSKITGGSGDLATAEWIAGRLAQSGYAISRQDVDVPFFTPSQAVLTVGDARFELYPQGIVAPTGPAGITASVAVVRSVEDAADARGCIALVILPFGRHATITQPPAAPLVKAVAEAGAVAVIIVPTGPSGDIVALNAPHAGPFVPIPAAILAPRLVAEVLRAARTSVMARMVIDGKAERRTSLNILATVARGKHWLALSTPRTGWFECAGERGTGAAVFLALADWAARRFPELSIFAMSTCGHEYGFLGTPRALDVAPSPADTLLWVHAGSALATRDALDWRGELVMLPSADPMRILLATDEIRPLVAEAFSGLAGLERPFPVMQGAGELSGILSRGYANGFAALGTTRWYHAPSDTLDKLDAGLLVPVLTAHQRAIEAVIERA